MRLGNIYVDHFPTDVGGAVFICTHFHLDHLRGLKKSFSGTIHCSGVTARMIADRFGHIRTRVVPLHTHITTKGQTFQFLDANHLPGSIMIHLVSQDILYTSDYRPNSRLLKAVSTHVRLVDTVYVDGTFHHPDLKFISEKQSLALMRTVLREPGTHLIGIHHVGVCTLLTKLKMKFFPHPSLSAYLINALETLFGEHLDPESDIQIVSSRTYPGHEQLLVPSALWFACRANMYKMARIVLDERQNRRINYSCHATFVENQALATRVNAQNVIPIGEPRAHLECSFPVAKIIVSAQNKK